MEVSCFLLGHVLNEDRVPDVFHGAYLSNLFVSLPSPDVRVTINPRESTFAFALILDELAFILALVFVCQSPLTLHIIVFPLSGVMLSIRPKVFAKATDVVSFKLSVVYGTISEGHLSLPFFHVVDIITRILCSVRPGFDSISMLGTYDPLTIKELPSSVQVGSSTMGLVILPASLLNVPVSVHKLTLPVGLITDPLTFILTFVRPYLRAEAVSTIV